MRRIFAVLAVLVAAAFALSGCEPNALPYAARVGPTRISNDSLTTTMQAVAQGKVSRCLFASDSIDGAGTNTYSMQFATTVLTFMVERALVANAIERYDLPVTPLATAASAHLLTNGLASSGQTCAPGVTDVAGELPPAFRNLLESYETYQAVLAAHLAGTSLTSSALADYAATHPLETQVTCVSEIVVSSKAQADAIAAQLRAGADFAMLARAHSLDTSTSANGGSLGCGPASDFPPEYSSVIVTLPTGAISEPIALESPYYGVVTVTARHPGNTLDAALGAIAAGSVQLSTLLAQLAATRVSIDPTYGEWAPSGGTYSVVGPTGPPPALISNLATLTPAAPSSSTSS